MIEIVFHSRIMELEMKGHAGHGKKGKDIVCSAASTLFYTLAESLNVSREMLAEPPVIKDEEGNGLIRCNPKKAYDGNIETMYWTVLIGLRTLAQNYPENVSFKVL